MNLSQDEILKVAKAQANQQKSAKANAIQSNSGVEAVAYRYKYANNPYKWAYAGINDTVAIGYIESDKLYLDNPDQSARIKELTNKVKNFDLMYDIIRANYERATNKLNDANDKVAELQATNAKLFEQVRVMREALEEINESGLLIGSYTLHDAMNDLLHDALLKAGD